ncbi:unnamed protein product [Coregonus sp. 'balchen']|nr:unnamed protein product [Coregonus sp. 'balchen']
MEICHSPWKSNTASSCNGGLLGDGKPGPDRDQKRLRHPGSRGSGAFFLGGFRFEIGSRDTCAFVLCYVSLSGTAAMNPVLCPEKQSQTCVGAAESCVWLLVFSSGVKP